MKLIYPEIKEVEVEVEIDKEKEKEVLKALRHCRKMARKNPYIDLVVMNGKRTATISYGENDTTYIDLSKGGAYLRYEYSIPTILQILKDE